MTNRPTIQTAAAEFLKSIVTKDDTPLMVKAHNAFGDYEIDAGELRQVLESAANQIVVLDRNGEQVAATVPKAKLDMICAGATRSDAQDMQAKAKSLAEREGVRANTYHVAGYMAAKALEHKRHGQWLQPAR